MFHHPSLHTRIDSILHCIERKATGGGGTKRVTMIYHYYSRVERSILRRSREERKILKRKNRYAYLMSSANRRKVYSKNEEQKSFRTASRTHEYTYTRTSDTYNTPPNITLVPYWYIPSATLVDVLTVERVVKDVYILRVSRLFWIKSKYVYFSLHIYYIYVY